MDRQAAPMSLASALDSAALRNLFRFSASSTNLSFGVTCPPPLRSITRDKPSGYVLVFDILVETVCSVLAMQPVTVNCFDNFFARVQRVAAVHAVTDYATWRRLRRT